MNTEHKKNQRIWLWLITLLILAVGLLKFGPSLVSRYQAAGEPAPRSAEPDPAEVTEVTDRTVASPPANASVLAEKWGVEFATLQLAAAGRVLDFRYKVLDPEKAAWLANPNYEAYVIDTSGKKILVPNTPSRGNSLRHAQKLAAQRTYSFLLANPGNSVRAGDKVTVVIGDFRAENLVVQ